VNGLLGSAGAAAPPVLARLAAERAAPDVEARRGQLFALVVEREKQAAAEVRAAAVALDSAARRAARAAARAESWKAKIDELTAKGGRPAEVLQAELEWYKSRGELVGEVMAWHRARVKFVLAVGSGN
jgi:hypothetical protein